MSTRSWTCTSPALVVAAAVVVFGLVGPASAAPQIGPLGRGFHGVGLLPEEGAAVAYGVRVMATSRDPATMEPEALPENLPGQIADTEAGVYTRDEWDKGALLRDNWSARWTGTLNVEQAGEYTFYLTTDDGARMAVDGGEIIDAWVPRPPTTSEATVNLAAGDHEVVVEFYEGGGGAVARLEWSTEGLDRQVIAAERVKSDGEPGWKAEYFTNVNLDGEPVVTRAEKIDNDWGEGGPRIGEEEPGQVVFEWTRIAPNAVVGRVHAGPETKIGLMTAGVGEAAEGQPRLAFRTVGDTQPLVQSADYPEALAWLPPTDGSYVFVAGFEPLPDTNLQYARQALREAALAGAEPNLPPGPADDEGWFALFDGQSFDGWKFRSGGSQGHWQVTEQGELDNAEHGGVDIYTEWTFGDCDLHIEFTYSKGSNSGVYLQGRYEIQVLDSHGQPVRDYQCGSIYRLVAPSENVTRPVGEWQSFDVDFRAATIDDDGRIVPARISLTHNDVLTVEDAEVPRATGGEMNRRYLQPGPILLQGTHGPVKFRNIKVRPK